MYSKMDYVRRATRFANNLLLPAHKKLSTLMFYATDSCDSGCKHCLIWSKRPVKQLPLSKIIEIMSSKCVSKHTTVGLEGGEFLLHPEATEILKWFCTNHPNFDLLSNCLKPDKVIEAVKQYPPKRLFISLDGPKETYLYMRGKDGYDNVLKVIGACKDLVPISLMFTLSPYNNFADLNHVVDVAKQNNIDIRIGIYNDIAFFDTIEAAHKTEIGSVKDQEKLSYRTVREVLQRKADEQKLGDDDAELNVNEMSDFKKSIPANVLDTSENYDFLLLYDEWKRKRLQLKCYSILDSLVIHPDGNVPICQNLAVSLGNVFNDSLDTIFNAKQTRQKHQHYVHNCNGCWINFHRKFDIVLLRTAEQLAPRSVIRFFYGKYHWTDKKMTYKKFLNSFS